MKELANCPFCKKPLKTKLIADFYFCKKCEIAVRNEEDMPSSGQRIYDKNWIRAQESEKTNFMRASYALKQAKNLHGIRTVLDVGCGTGILVDTLNQSGYMADGIDTSPEAIEFAKSNKKGNFYLSSMESFKSERKYDLIIATQLIEHLRRPENFLTSVKKVLKAGGYLHIEAPNLYSWNKKSIWRRRIGGMFYGTGHRICYTAKSLTRLLQNNNFGIYKVFTKTYSPIIFTEIIKTLSSAFAKKEKEQKESPTANSTDNGAKNLILFTDAYRAIYKWTKDSFVVSVFLFAPNRASEINDRGNQLIVIAENNTLKREALS